MSRLRSALAGLAVLLSPGCLPMVIPPGEAAVAPAVEGDTLITTDGTALPLRTWQAATGTPTAVVLALHGFNEYSGCFDDPGRWFGQRGITSYAYDQRGFGAAPARGLWPGEDALADDLVAAIKAIGARHPGTPLYLLGESMGAAVIMTAMARPGAPAVAGIILIAPAIWGRSSMPWYQTLALWVAAHTIPGTGLSGRGLGIRASDNIEMLKARGRDPEVIKQTRIDTVYGLVNLMDRAMESASNLRGRALILYGEQDQLIPAGAIAEMLARLPPNGDGNGNGERRYGLYPAGYHMLLHDLQGEVVRKDIAAWIGDAAAPLPSAADIYAVETGSCPANLC